MGKGLHGIYADFEKSLSNFSKKYQYIEQCLILKIKTDSELKFSKLSKEWSQKTDLNLQLKDPN